MFEGSVIDASDVHPLKTPSRRVMMVEGSVIDTTDEQL